MDLEFLNLLPFGFFVSAASLTVEVNRQIGSSSNLHTHHSCTGGVTLTNSAHMDASLQIVFHTLKIDVSLLLTYPIIRNLLTLPMAIGMEC